MADMRALIQTHLAPLREAQRREPMPPLQTRLGWLDALERLVHNHRDAFAQAIAEDFGHRSVHETWLAEVLPLLLDLRHTRQHLRRWMRPRRAATAWQFWPGRSFLLPQPLGVVAVISPWNYPLLLSLGPAMEALAAGNRVLLKPSELTPRFSALLATRVTEHLPPDVMGVLTGGPEVGEALCAEPLDHLFFTGSTRVGRLVAREAAAVLTPVTLELGGKSPAIVSASADLDRACASIVTGKAINAGQTCIAPDHLLVHETHRPRLEQALQAAFRRQYPDLARPPDYSAIIAPAHFERLLRLRDEAVTQGARALELASVPGWPDAVRRRMAPTLLFDVNDGMAVMQEEIFGPLLPVLFYRTLDEALAQVRGRDRPLALYWFGHNARERERVLRETHAGGVTVNDCLLHIAQNDLPFGGVGPSGQGAYHGRWGFDNFSKLKPVFVQSRWSGVPLLRPPYKGVFRRMQRWLG